MILGMQASSQSKLRNLVIGLGGGGLVNYIHHFLKELSTTVVEIDPEIVKVAKEYFGLVEDGERLKVVVDDGLKYMMEQAAASKPQFQSILFDVDSKDQSLGISCPPNEFLDPEVLKTVKSLLPNDGAFVLNFVCRDSSSRDQTVNTLKQIFSSVLSYKLDEDVNEIFYCFKEPMKDFNERFSRSGKKLNTIKNDMIDVKDLMEKLKLN
jgi:spermidine synthase